LPVQLSNPKRHSPPSKRFEALIDSGASRCIFHSQIGRSLGFDIESGREERTVGVSGKATTVYIHGVGLFVCGGIITLKVAFCEDLPIAGLLGRRGFLEQFRFTFDPSSMPPVFDLERIYRV
jgi:hypothetical protein